MKITIITVGKIKEKYLKDAIAEYSKRLGKYCKLEIVEVADEKTPDNASEVVEDSIRSKEAERILKYVKDDAYVVTLEINGKQLTSEELADKMARKAIKTGKSITLEPMKAYERKIIHSRLQNSDKVLTKSIGEEPRRKVVICLK